MTSAAQVLLRIPALAVFLENHAQVCEAGVQEDCVTCMLCAAKRELQGKDVPALVLRRQCVSARFDANTEHNVAEFLQGLLDGMAAAENEAGRALRDPYGGAVENAPVITHLERLFSFLEERRLRCPSCQIVTRTFQRKACLLYTSPSPRD